MSRIISLLLLPGDALPVWRRFLSSYTGQHGRALHPAAHHGILRRSFPALSRFHSPARHESPRVASDRTRHVCFPGTSTPRNRNPIHEIPRLPRRLRPPLGTRLAPLLLPLQQRPRRAIRRAAPTRQNDALAEDRQLLQTFRKSRRHALAPGVPQLQ